MPTNFDDIIFDEASHTYSLYGQPLTGVTRMLGRLKPPFDAPSVTACIAERGRSGRRLCTRRWICGSGWPPGYQPARR